MTRRCQCELAPVLDQKKKFPAPPQTPSGYPVAGIKNEKHSNTKKLARGQ